MTMLARDSRRCSDVMRDESVDPVGTAPSHDGILVIEWPLPWSARVEDLPALKEVMSLQYGLDLSIRTQLVVGREASTGLHRVFLYYRHDRSAGVFSRLECVTDPEGMLSAIDGMFARMVRSRGCVPRAAGLAEGVPRVSEVLVCGHGARDVCCGSRGTKLFRSMSESPPADVAIWRTSHLGGHRFAPTVLTLPDGQYWAYMDERSLRAIIARTRPFRDFVGMHRGSASVRGIRAQAVDRALALRFGWEWFNWPRTVGDGSDDPGGTDGSIEVVAYPPGSPAIRAEAIVDLGGHLELAPCRGQSGKPIEQAIPILRHLALTSTTG